MESESGSSFAIASQPFKKMICKEWLELEIKISGKIFDAAVIGFKWGKTFWLSRHEANFDFE